MKTAKKSLVGAAKVSMSSVGEDKPESNDLNVKTADYFSQEVIQG